MTSSSTSHGMCMMPSMLASTRVGTFSHAMIQPNGALAAMIKQMVPVVTIEEVTAAMIFWKVSSL